MTAWARALFTTHIICNKPGPIHSLHITLRRFPLTLRSKPVSRLSLPFPPSNHKNTRLSPVPATANNPKLAAIMPTVSVKWQKELYPAVEIDTTQPPYVFKGQLYDLTGVPPERQKIMMKGGILKDDSDWSKLGLKEGQKLMMVGTADEIVKAPEKGTVFMEDLPEEEQVIAVGHSAGLFNLGNTCYMNSTMQCLHSVPELKSALIEYPQSGRSNELDQTSHLLTVATRDLFNELDKNVKPVTPMQFWMVLRKKYPQFGQLHNGSFMQQDAEECWTQILYTLSQALRSPSISVNLDTVKELFGIDFTSRNIIMEDLGWERNTWFPWSCNINHQQEIEQTFVFSSENHIFLNYPIQDPPKPNSTVCLNPIQLSPDSNNHAATIFGQHWSETLTANIGFREGKNVIPITNKTAGSLESLDCLLSATTSSDPDDGISVIFPDYNNSRNNIINGVVSSTDSVTKEIDEQPKVKKLRSDPDPNPDPDRFTSSSTISFRRDDGTRRNGFRGDCADEGDDIHGGGFPAGEFRRRGGGGEAEEEKREDIKRSADGGGAAAEGEDQ
ncbi:hypothetical protein SSX86_025814 [Deinandra increscens subsp. villosa]|uniref:ubiquitinyl hydrolase 1 n=1 Tax=Deinandra increscens subsp. villosa TaxID=3103831 RepID=A0AAP0GPI3_9ASTR